MLVHLAMLTHLHLKIMTFMHVQIVQVIIDGNLGQMQAAKDYSWWHKQQHWKQLWLLPSFIKSFAWAAVLCPSASQLMQYVSARWHYTQLYLDMFTVEERDKRAMLLFFSIQAQWVRKPNATCTTCVKRRVICVIYVLLAILCKWDESGHIFYRFTFDEQQADRPLFF